MFVRRGPRAGMMPLGLIALAVMLLGCERTRASKAPIAGLALVFDDCSWTRSRCGRSRASRTRASCPMRPSCARRAPWRPRRGGHGTEYGMTIPTVAWAEDAAAFVAERVERGVDHIKIVDDDGHAAGVEFGNLDQATLDALIVAARARAARRRPRLGSRGCRASAASRRRRARACLVRYERRRRDPSAMLS